MMENSLLCVWRLTRTWKMKMVMMVTAMVVSFGIYVTFILFNIIKPLPQFPRTQLQSERKASVPLEPNVAPLETNISWHPKRILLWTTLWFHEKHWEKMFVRLTSGQCKVSSCELVYDHRLLDSADAVVFHPIDLHPNYKLPPRHRPQQPWVFFSLEPPPIVVHRRDVNLTKLEGVFNWTMTYRLDSDVPVPYGRVHPKPESNDPPTDKNYWASKTQHTLVVWFVSNCHTPSRRENFVEALSRHIEVDVFGGCGPNKCGRPISMRTLGTFRIEPCETIIAEYMFYLAFENSICKDYVTEKFYNALTLDVVPVVLGGADYTAIAPPNSYINALDFASPKQLADYIHQVAYSEELYNKYFEWKNHYTVELGHPFSAMTCNLCSQLHEVDSLNNSSCLARTETDGSRTDSKRHDPPGNYSVLQEWFVEDSACWAWTDEISDTTHNVLK